MIISKVIPHLPLIGMGILVKRRFHLFVTSEKICFRERLFFHTTIWICFFLLKMKY